MTGTLFVIAAPSGTGKTSLVRALRERDPFLHVAVSCTTRPPRDGEQEGEDYYFMEEPLFQEKIKKGHFLEYASVFGSSYGTPKSDVFEHLSAGHDLILEIDWQGAKQVFEGRGQSYPCIGIFVWPPSYHALAQRLRERAKDPEARIQRRLKEACMEVTEAELFDYWVVNQDFNETLKVLEQIVAASRFKKECQKTRPEMNIIQKSFKELL
jgi:guanylate kinase